MSRHNPLTDPGTLVANLPVAVYRTTPDGRIAAGNEALARLVGAASVAELTDIDVRRRYVDPRVRERITARMAAGEEILTEEIELERLDGRRIWVRVSSRGAYDDDGNVVYYEGILEDVTTARATRSALAKSNAMRDALTRIQNRFIAGGDAGTLFDLLLADLLAVSRSEYGFIAGVRHDETGAPFLRGFAMTNIAWNEATRRMFEENGPQGMEFHNLDTLFGKPVTDRRAIISNDPLNDPRRAGRPQGHPPLDSFLGLPVLKGQTVLGVIALANRPEGYDEALVEELQPLVATVGSMIQSIRNEEARQAAEARERSREELYRAVVEHAAEAVIALGEDGTIRAFNPAAEEMTGYQEAEMIGRSIALVLPDDGQVDWLDRDGSGVEPATAETTVRHRDGTTVPVEMSMSRTDVGDRTIVTAILRDIRERKAIEEALRAAKESAERTSRAKDEFLAGMSHELRTPLNAVIGLASILGRQVHGSVNSKQKEYLDQIEESGRHLLALINDILDLAKIEADKLEAELERVLVGPLVDSAVSVVREAAVAKRLKIQIDVDWTLPSVVADPRRTKQVLLNLLSNAIKFTEPGGTIGVEATVEAGALAVTVWDTGVGIPAERLGDIFAPFEQVDHSLARRHEGTGLGLTLSRKFVEMQNGRLTVESDERSGSRFTFTLPLEAALPTDAATESNPSQPDTALPNGAPHARVLVVEDNDVNRLLVTDYLEAYGYHTEVALDGFEAVEKAKALRPDVILMDVQLPRRDGLSATREIKADPETANIPVIALTALAMRGDAERCLEAGCDAYLSKPCDPADVLAVVENLARDGIDGVG